MCTLIYATVPSRADLARIPPTTAHLVADDVRAEFAAKVAGQEQPCFVAGVPHCGGGGHCGTVLGRALTRPGRNENLEAQAERLRKRGWSAHKVEAWLAQKRAPRPSRPPKMSADVDELALWRELLEAALEEARLEYVGLLVCEAGDEPDIPSRIESVRYSGCDLTRLERGVLYRLHR
jgi:hypothetical protein